MQLTNDQEKTILWSMLHEPGDSLAREVFEARGPKALEDFRSGCARDVWSEIVSEEYRGQVGELIERVSLRLPKINLIDRIERGIRWNARVYFEDQHPRLFRGLSHLGPHRPYLLWVAGDPEILAGESVSIVGTRSPSSIGLANAKRLVRELASPVSLVGQSGLMRKPIQPQSNRASQPSHSWPGASIRLTRKLTGSSSTIWFALVAHSPVRWLQARPRQGFDFCSAIA